jgi:hypothetical protein
MAPIMIDLFQREEAEVREARLQEEVRSIFRRLSLSIFDFKVAAAAPRWRNRRRHGGERR